LVVGDLYRYKQQLSFDPFRYMTYKIVTNVDHIRCRFIYQGSYNDCLEKFSNICTDLVVKKLKLIPGRRILFLRRS
jgi:hypothetical protein